MRKFTLNIFTLSLGLAVMPMVEAAPTAQQQLLEQVRLGEATHREDLVQQSLYRLELIDPNNPDVVAARFRSLLRQGDIDGAQKQLDRLSQLAPSSNAYKSSRTTMLLSTPDGRQALQQARLQATTGHAEEAVASYNKLFNGAPPEGDIAVEYWSTVAKIPARRGEAINQLKRINADTPGNTGLQNNLALLLFSSDRRDEGFAVLEQMAKSNAGREGASKIWYGQIKDMPVSDASVSALKKYLSIFSDGDSVAAAQSQLAEQQKQLADPAFRARAQGLAAVDSGMAGKAIPELQQAVRANPKDSEALGALGQAYSQKGDRANAVANLEKALALDPHSSNNDKWNSLLKVNRYWLAIQQGDAALKANNPDRAENACSSRRVMSITPTAMQCWGWAMWRWREKIIPPPNVIISRPCVWTAATLTPCAGWRIYTASNRQKKLKRLSPRSLPVSGEALMISNAACKTTVWHSRQRHWKTRANGRRRQHFSGNDWRWTPAAYGLLTDFRRISGRPDNAARPIR